MMEVKETGNIKGQIKEKMARYYQEYYLETLSLPDWESRVAWRLEQEEAVEEERILRVQQLLNLDLSGKKVLVVGIGTGGTLKYLQSMGADVYGIDPDAEALDVVHLRCGLYGLSPDKFTQDVAEELPYEDNTFDFIYCWSVLEHVDSFERTLLEMIRVVKKDACIYIQSADYRHILEGHYKLPMVPKFVPGSRMLTMIWLRLRRKNPDFYKRQVNYVGFEDVRRILINQEVTFMRVFRNMPKRLRDPRQRSGWVDLLKFWMYELFGIRHVFEIFIIKNSYRQ